MKPLGISINGLALELHVDEGGPSVEALHEAHLKILAQKPLIIWGNIPEPDLDWLFRKLPPAGLAIITVVSSPEHAGEIFWFNKNAKGELWLNAKASKFASKKTGAADSAKDSDTTGKKSDRGGRGRKKSAATE